MSTPVTQILASIKSEIADVLGGSYSELPHGIILTDNSQDKSEKRYQVIPLDSTETSSITRNYTVNQPYEVTLTDKFTKAETDDISKRAVSTSLMDLAHDLYNRLIKNLPNIEPLAIIVSDFRVRQPTYNIIKDLALVQFTLTVRFKQSLN